MSEGTSDDMFMLTVIHGTFGLHLPACHSVPQIICTCMAGYLILHWPHLRKYHRLCELTCMSEGSSDYSHVDLDIKYWIQLMSKGTSDYMYYMYMYDDSCISENKEIQQMSQRVSQFTWTCMSVGSSD